MERVLLPQSFARLAARVLSAEESAGQGEREGRALAERLLRPLLLESDTLIVPLKEIASGSFGVVFEGEFDRKHSAPAADAVIAVKIEDVPDTDDAQLNVLAELLMLARFCHCERVVTVHAAAFREDPDRGMAEVLIAMELCEHGALREALQVGLSWQLRIRLAMDIAEGLQAMHAEGIIHRDIKTVNVLVTDLWRAKLCDFSFCTHRDDPELLQYVYGTTEFMAPEIEMGEPYDEMVDMFSFGVTLAEMICLLAPGKDGFLERGPQTLFAADEENVKEKCPRDCPPSLQLLALQCLSSEPSDRPSAEEALEWLQSLLEDMGGLRVELFPASGRKLRRRQSTPGNLGASSLSATREGHVRTVSRRGRFDVMSLRAGRAPRAESVPEGAAAAAAAAAAPSVGRDDDTAATALAPGQGKSVDGNANRDDGWTTTLSNIGGNDTSTAKRPAPVALSEELLSNLELGALAPTSPISARTVPDHSSPESRAASEARDEVVSPEAIGERFTVSSGEEVPTLEKGMPADTAHQRRDSYTESSSSGADTTGIGANARTMNAMERLRRRRQQLRLQRAASTPLVVSPTSQKRLESDPSPSTTKAQASGASASATTANNGNDDSKPADAPPSAGLVPVIEPKPEPEPTGHGSSAERATTASTTSPTQAEAVVSETTTPKRAMTPLAGYKTALDHAPGPSPASEAAATNKSSEEVENKATEEAIGAHIAATTTQTGGAATESAKTDTTTATSEASTCGQSVRRGVRKLFGSPHTPRADAAVLDKPDRPGTPGAASRGGSAKGATPGGSRSRAAAAARRGRSTMYSSRNEGNAEDKEQIAHLSEQVDQLSSELERLRVENAALRQKSAEERQPLPEPLQTEHRQSKRSHNNDEPPASGNITPFASSPAKQQEARRHAQPATDKRR